MQLQMPPLSSQADKRYMYLERTCGELMHIWHLRNEAWTFICKRATPIVGGILAVLATVHQSIVHFLFKFSNNLDKKLLLPNGP